MGMTGRDEHYTMILVCIQLITLNMLNLMSMIQKLAPAKAALLVNLDQKCGIPKMLIDAP